VPWQVPYAEIGSKTLVFDIFDFDRFSKHDQIGAVLIPLNSVDLGRVVEEWRDLVSPESDDKVRRCVRLIVDKEGRFQHTSGSRNNFKSGMIQINKKIKTTVNAFSSGQYGTLFARARDLDPAR